MKKRLTRRTFIQSAAATGLAAAASVSCGSTRPVSYKRIVGANDRISIGIIGCGDRGINAHMPGVHEHAESQNIEIIAVCDPWRIARETANAKVKEWYGRDAKQFVSYRDLLQMKEIDAVMIASCDHQHTDHLEAAARAGVDVYVEKPLAKRMDRLVRAVDAVKQADVVVQVGTQLRSMGSFTGCRKLYGTGILGTVGRIEQCRNSERPYWYRYIKDVDETDLDWKEFLHNLPARPFDRVAYSGWYGYREFSDGPVPGLGSHFIDLVHYITGAQFPDSCVCLGGTYTWIDDFGFTCPDHVQALWTYPEGFMVSYSTNFGNGYGNSFKIFGNQGVLKMVNWNAPVLTAEGGSANKGIIRGENPVEEVERPDHFLDWLQCLRSRGTPNASIDAGYQHAVACLMAVESFDSGRRMTYNADKRTLESA